MTLLNLLKARYNASKTWTDSYIREVKQCLEDYKCEKDQKLSKQEAVNNRHLSAKRYELPIPYIYSTHESFMASLFEKQYDLIYSGKGKMDEEKADKLKAVYKYLYDKLDLEGFLNDSAWWFLLSGFISSYQTYEIKISHYENMSDSDGNPMIDELGQNVTVPVYEWHDPKIYIDDPEKTYFAPDSEFSTDSRKVPYIIREKLLDRDEVKLTFDIDDIEPTEELTIKGFKSNSNEAKDDIKRVKVMYYCGTLPEENKNELIENYGKKWEYGKNYYIAYTNNKLLYTGDDEKYSVLAKWFGPPNSFFGFGLGKTLRSSQKEMSIRRGQQVRYADLYTFPWLLLDGQTKIDQNALIDIQKRKPLIYTGNKPEYLVPPEMSKTTVQADQISRSDAQFISGTLDMSKGAQETNTVKTATGQQLFAQSQDKRINKARKAIGKYFKQVMINLMKLCQQNWEDEKLITITDDEGNEYSMAITKDDLSDVNFDTDIDIQLADISVNKETQSQRSIDLYDKVKDDPLIDRKKIFIKMLKDGFNVKNPESYLLPEGTEGTQNIGNEPSETLQNGQDQGNPADMQEEDLSPVPNAPNLLGNEQRPNPTTTF